ncbi:gluconate 5-dehydrogenase [Hyaloscypha variabilis]|uniref:Gluconate 5-dehydrogenase n=1 Tax=Hyaloscypha variabilis (strain UAMH 11265 / GT02V1 / F) TaxID=1149755 RepID=A0A2J6QUS3_HYAVF|nr:gluconate 5-dehydrogenase [Hyaloscypha variabilis F]
MANSTTVFDLFKLDGKTALVTGANGGIGAAMATALAEAGADIIIVQIPGDTSDFHTTISALGRKVSVYDCDLAGTRNIRDCVAKILSDGHVIDILINCAGVSGHRAIEDVDDEFREKVFNINMTANYVLTQEVGKHMIARGKGGKVLNVSSLAGMIATKNISAYAGTKGAVNQFTSAFANEWAKHNIQVNCVCPGYILTPLTKGYFENEVGFKEYILSRTPMGRWGLPDDFKGLTLFFCSAASDYVTGVRMPLDGGMHGR